MTGFKSADDFKAFTDAVATVDAARRQALRRVFEGTTLKPAPLRAAMHVKGIQTQLVTVRSEASGIAKGVVQGATQSIQAAVRRQITQLIAEMFDEDLLAEVMDFISVQVLEDIAEIIAEVAPYLGIAKSGAYVAIDLFKIGNRSVQLIHIERAKGSYAPGDAQAALDALQKLVAVEMARAAVNLAADTAALGGKVGGLFADLGVATGPLIGLARAIVKLVQRVMIAALDYRDMVAGNRRLAHPSSLDATAFGECPLLACYFLASASDSDLLNYLTMEIGTRGFVVKVETLKKKISSARDVAAGAIDSSRFVLHKGDGEYVPQGMANGVVARKKREISRYAANFKRQVMAALPGRG